MSLFFNYTNMKFIPLPNRHIIPENMSGYILNLFACAILVSCDWPRTGWENDVSTGEISNCLYEIIATVEINITTKLNKYNLLMLLHVHLCKKIHTFTVSLQKFCF